MRMVRARCIFSSPLLLLIFLTPLLSSTAATGASGQARMVESSLRAKVDSFKITIQGKVEMAGDWPLTMHLALVDPQDRVIASARDSLRRGDAPGSFHMELAASPGQQFYIEQLLWTRVRYELRQGKKDLASGTVALAAICADVFDVKVARPEVAVEGTTYRVRVRVENPVTKRAVAGAHVRVMASFGAKPHIQQSAASKTTNGAGDAVVELNLPKKITDSDGDLRVEAEKDGVIRTRTDEIHVGRGLRLIVSTDKRLYQPGQELHVRTLAFDATQHALRDTALEFELTDPDNQTVFRDKATTNRFGIARLDWALPESLRLGDYSLNVTYDGEDESDNETEQARIRVSRYELPQFAVEAALDKPYYLAGENAEVKVAARYLFGKPVTAGAVRVARESEREWSSTQRKYVSTEEESYKAELGKDGQVKVALELAKLHEDFKDETYQRFRDYNFAAYVTDASTGRTEQRRFRVRVTREAIHVYVAGEQMRQEGMSLFVSTFYADGTPAAAKVRISAVPPFQNQSGWGTREEAYLQTVKTNRYGLAKVEGLRLPTQAKTALAWGTQNATQNENYELRLQVVDGKGRTADYVEQLYVPGRTLVVTTDHPLYKPGEAIVATVEGPRTAGRTIVELVKGFRVLKTRTVNLRSGPERVTFPWDGTFEGELSIVAYSLDDVISAYNFPAGSATVLYPIDPNLEVKISPTKTTYQPGEEAVARVNVATSKGAAVESAVGVLVVDKAVEERVRTDEEFDGEGSPGFWSWNWWRPQVNFGAVARADLDKIDMRKPLPEGMELVAEFLLRTGGGPMYFPQISGYDYDQQTAQKFEEEMRALLIPVRRALDETENEVDAFPKNKEELERVLAEKRVDSAKLLDPWGMPFQFEFAINDRYRTVTAVSAGPDKQFQTNDDIRPEEFQVEYFTPIGRLMERAIREAHASRGVWIRDYDSLRQEMLKYGVDLATLRDPEGNAYGFGFGSAGKSLLVTVRAKRTSGEYSYPLWTSAIDFFAETQAKIDSALALQARTKGGFPRSEEELRSVLQEGGDDWSTLRDPWGNPYFATFTRSARYGDIVVIAYNASNQQQTTPVTQMVDWIEVQTAGPDGKRGTADDAVVARFSQVVTTQAGKDASPQKMQSPPLEGSTGAIGGTVTDQSGAVIPGATATAKRQGDDKEYSATVGSDGKYLIKNLPTGRYSVRVTARAFRAVYIQDVPVHSASLTTVNTVLQVGTASETVEVSAAVALVQTTNSAVAAKAKVMAGTTQVKEETFTPRVRQFFPETLYWEPSLITDASGRTNLKFKLADNITTWKLQVVASTEDGKVGEAETEIGAFQPFFVEHDPPPVLTVGDEIELPVIVRNYSSERQQVQVTLKPEGWFETRGAAEQPIDVEPSEPGKAIFRFRAVAAQNGKQRVTAANRKLGDAVEKPIRVHPDGEEKSVTAARILSSHPSKTSLGGPPEIQGGTPQTLRLQVPVEAMAGSIRAELKIYPNLLAHVVESIEASLERPYGCGEQTISSTYPSVLLLKYFQMHPNPSRAKEARVGHPHSDFEAKAQRYAEIGYRRLLDYRDASGGFTYWGRGEPDVALTAYAVRFLSDARQVMEVDANLITSAQEWLVVHQNPNGSWEPHYGGDQGVTAYVAQTLSAEGLGGGNPERVRGAVKKALSYLEHESALEDPYVAAAYAIAAKNAGELERAQPAITRLRATSHKEGNGEYWALETNTPFYGWGTAGRVETSALALQALALAGSSDDTSHIDSGLLFLLANKDRYGVWYSGQATVNVVQAMLQLLNHDAAEEAAGQVAVIVNGTTAEELHLPAANVMTGPMRLDLSKWVKAGANEIELRRTQGSARASVQAVATFYVPWSAQSDKRERIRTGESHGLRLAVNFERQEASVGDAMQCEVQAERVGHHGYGMLLAEVGLPPASEVDRASLEEAVKESGWGLQRYDVLPDRVVLYLWPRAGGSKVAFRFKPRMGMEAKSAASVLYDYYNPEASVTVGPVEFRVQ